MNQSLSDEQRIYFRDLFRESRFAALRDAEGFDATLFALERFGKFYRRRDDPLETSDFKFPRQQNGPLLPKKFQRSGQIFIRVLMTFMINFAMRETLHFTKGRLPVT